MKSEGVDEAPFFLMKLLSSQVTFYFPSPGATDSRYSRWVSGVYKIGTLKSYAMISQVFM